MDYKILALNIRLRAFINTKYLNEVERGLIATLGKIEEKDRPVDLTNRLMIGLNEREKMIGEQLPALEKIAKKLIPDYAPYQLTIEDKIALINTLLDGAQGWLQERGHAELDVDVAKITKLNKDAANKRYKVAMVAIKYLEGLIAALGNEVKEEEGVS